MKPWLVALDIDGTLLHFGGEVSSAVRSALKAVKDAGHHVVLASGRSLVSMAKVAPGLDLADGWMVCSNGAVVVRAVDPAIEPTGWDVVHMSTFDPEPALRRLAAAMPDARFAVEDVGIGFRLTELFPEGELDGHHTVVELDNLWGSEVTRVVVRGEHQSNDEFRAIVAELGLQDVAYAVGWSAWMDIAPFGVTKAAGLERVREALGIPQARTMAIGDGDNDIEMLQWAARGVAMGQASALVKSAASEVTESIDDDGAALALMSLL